METVTKVLYEAMFLVDSAEAASDWNGINQLISDVLEKFGAQTVSMRKWDECRLAYEINRKGRGTYILCYFRCEGAKIQEIERAVQLSERIMRVLILNAEHMTQEDIDKATPATLATERSEAAAAAAAEKEKEQEREAAAAAAEKEVEPEQEASSEIKEDLEVEDAAAVDAIESEAPAAKPESEEESEAQQQEE